MTMPRASRIFYGDSGLQAKRVALKQAESKVEFQDSCGSSVLGLRSLPFGLARPIAIFIPCVDHVRTLLPRECGAEAHAEPAQVAFVPVPSEI